MMNFMIPKISRGSNPAGLLRYLFGKGRHNEHRNQHLIAASDDMVAAFDIEGTPERSFRELGELFDKRYRRLLSEGRSCPPDRRSLKRNPDHADGLDRVWHCSLSLRAEDGILTDQQWSDIVTDYLKRMNILDADGEGATWVAVRHGLSRNGNDHVHVMVQLARDDDWINPYNDRRHAQNACRRMEHERPELTPLAAMTDRDHIRYTYREWRQWAEWKARQEYTGYVPWAELDTDDRTRLTAGIMADSMPRIMIGRLVRACAAASRSEDEFIRRVRREGLNIDPRLRKGVAKGTFGRREQVVGYTITWRSADGWTERVNATALGSGMRLKELRESWGDGPNDSNLAVQEWRAAMENRRPVMHAGRERRLEGLTTHDMSVLIDRAFRIADRLEHTDADGIRQAEAEALREFDRLLDRYGLTESIEWPETLTLDLGTGPGTGYGARPLA